MKQRVMILGASGMAGHVITLYLKELNKYDVYTVCRKISFTHDCYIVDIFEISKLERIINEVRPDFIINCIGLLIKGSKASTANAVYINAYFPHLLSKLGTLYSFKTIHISTDCVFSGAKGGYRDSDIKDALDVYGMTKNLGELVNARDLTIRTSIIGPEQKTNGEGLFHWLFVNRNNESITGYAKSFWGGVTTLELAKFIDFAIARNIIGLYQLSNSEKISKYDLLDLLILQFKLKVRLIKVSGQVLDKSIISSAIDGIEYKVPLYKLMVLELYNFMIEHFDIYKQYLEG